MTDADAFLEAIHAAPGDDLPRLVYADWLEEHGEPEYAAFVRLQCEVERLPRDGLGRVLARSREKAAWAAVAARWGAVVTECGFTQASFRRGLPAGPVGVPAAAFVRHAADWWPRLPVRAVTLLDPDDAPGWAACPHLARVEELRLDRSPYRLPDAARGAMVPTDRYVPGMFGEFPEAVLTELARCRHLDRVSVVRVAAVFTTRAGLDALAAAPWLAGVRELELVVVARRWNGTFGLRALSAAERPRQTVAAELRHLVAVTAPDLIDPEGY